MPSRLPFQTKAPGSFGWIHAKEEEMMTLQSPFGEVRIKLIQVPNTIMDDVSKAKTEVMDVNKKQSIT